MHFVGYFMLSNVPNWEDFSKISIFGVIFCQNLGFWPLRCPYTRLIPFI